MLLVVDGESVEHSKLTQVENAIDPVVVAELRAHQVSRYVKNDQPLEVLQLDRLLHVTDHVVAKVELHEALQVFETIQSLDFVVLERQLCQADKTLNIGDALNLV